MRIINPYGQQVFLHDIHGHNAELVANISGKYTILLDEIDERSIALPYRMAVFVHQPTAPRVIDLTPAPRQMDLVVEDVQVTNEQAGQQIYSGNIINISWKTINKGIKSTHGDFVERVLIKNNQTGAIIAQAVLPYSETQSGVLLPNQSINRYLKIRLPNGDAGVGVFTAIVETDGANSQIETGTDEQNNQAAFVFSSKLAVYADLQVKNITILPDATWQAGEKVIVSWQTSNNGSAAARGHWVERVELINLSTGKSIAVVDVPIEETLLSGQMSQTRIAELTWAKGIHAIGRFEMKVHVDAQAQLIEYGAGAEEDNTEIVVLENGPDLVTENLVVDTVSVYAGGRVSIRWQDVNKGDVAIPMHFQDRVQVYAKNKDGSLGSLIVNTSVVFAEDKVHPLQAGERRQRSFAFDMPHGEVGEGEFIVMVSVDHDATGQSLIFEVNAIQDAEENNSIQTQLISKQPEYADLQVMALSVPTQVLSGKKSHISWMVQNHGNVHATGDWFDRIILTQDDILGNGDDIILANVVHRGGLKSGESYVAEAEIDIPLRLNGQYRIALVSDAEQKVLEPNTRFNNIRFSTPFAIMQTYMDLIVQDITLSKNAVLCSSCTKI